MTNRPENYRECVKLAEDLAARAHDPEVKRVYLETADRWRRAADTEERSDPPTPEIHRQQQQQPDQKAKREGGDG
jgi:hypothetical protein